MSEMDKTAAKRTVLYLEKRFLAPRLEREPDERGYFTLCLLRDLAALGFHVTVPARADWAADLKRSLGDAAPEILACPANWPATLGAVLALFRARRRRFGTLLTDDSAAGLIPELSLIRHMGMAARATLIARRMPSSRLVAALGRFPTTVAAANRRVAEPFTGGLYGRVEVYDGIAGADRFAGPRPEKAADEPVAFCVAGDLSAGWRAANAVIRAFQRLPPETAAHARLHLASFQDAPPLNDARVVCHPRIAGERRGSFLAGMDVMVAPGREEDCMRETFGEAAVQGMLAGLPLIANDAPGLAEKVNDGGGLLFQTEAELATALAALVHDPDRRRRLGERARRTAAARYVWNTAEFAKRFL